MSLKRKILVAGVVGGAVWAASKLRKANKRYESGRFEEDRGPIELDIDEDAQDESEEKEDDEGAGESEQEEEEFECTVEGCSRAFDTEHGRNVHEGQVH